MSTGSRYPIIVARSVAHALVAALSAATDRIIIAGSIRRGKDTVGDVEIVYIPKLATLEAPQGDLFIDNSRTRPRPDFILDALLAAGHLAKRPNAKGYKIWGPKNKLATHVASGIPIDLFAASEENWHNYLVCRTGPAALNMRIAEAAKRKGWTWNPYGPGFTTADGRSHTVTSEEDVFAFVGLPYLAPEDRS